MPWSSSFECCVLRQQTLLFHFLPYGCCYLHIWVIDISLSNLDSSLRFIQPAFCTVYSSDMQMTPPLWQKVRKESERGQQRWDGWMASLIQWTWVWANSRRWWRTGRPGILQSMGSQRVGHNWATEQQLLSIDRFLLVKMRFIGSRWWRCLEWRLVPGCLKAGRWSCCLPGQVD